MLILSMSAAFFGAKHASTSVPRRRPFTISAVFSNSYAKCISGFRQSGSPATGCEALQKHDNLFLRPRNELGKWSLNSVNIAWQLSMRANKIFRPLY